MAVVLALQLDDDGVAVDADEADVMGSLGVGAVLLAYGQQSLVDKPSLQRARRTSRACPCCSARQHRQSCSPCTASQLDDVIA